MPLSVIKPLSVLTCLMTFAPFIMFEGLSEHCLRLLQRPFLGEREGTFLLEKEEEESQYCSLLWMQKRNSEDVS